MYRKCFVIHNVTQTVRTAKNTEYLLLYNSMLIDLKNWFSALSLRHFPALFQKAFPS